MAYRRIGDSFDDPAEREQNWSQAEELLKQSIELQYADSETYGIYGGLVKQRLVSAVTGLTEMSINTQRETSSTARSPTAVLGRFPRGSHRKPGATYRAKE